MRSHTQRVVILLFHVDPVRDEVRVEHVASEEEGMIRLQRFKDGGLPDLKTFKGGDGLTWVDAAGRVFTQSIKDLAAWRGNRADAGRVRPDRFLTNNKFGQASANGKHTDGK